MQWWSVWYPGAEPGGGSYIAQRMLASKNERDALGATLWFNVAHYALRPWPWIIVALASMLVFPDARPTSSARFRTSIPALIGNDIAYPAMLTFLPVGMQGLIVAGALRGVSLDDRDAPQLGHVLSRHRLLSALPRARKDRAALRVGLARAHRGADDRCGCVHAVRSRPRARRSSSCSPSAPERD